LMTSASVALADCFVAFLLPIQSWFHESDASTGQFGSCILSRRVCIAIRSR
jgi:hypothetical protein